jgi:2-methylisocitrate lyase-like PEP mutase family enzyme
VLTLRPNSSRNDEMSRPSLRAALNSGEIVIAPGIHDMIAAVISNKIGFDFVYGSGFWTTASAYGLPDAGIATYTQMLDRMATLTRTVRASVIADADTGYGGLLNVHHTVRGYEAAGIAGIQIEDQEFPKKCGHTPFKRVVPMIDMVEKVKVACEARTNPEETIIIARTDARQTDGFEGAVKRGIAYGEAGADVVFLEALESEAEMREACARIHKPMMANMADGGKTPIYSKPELAALGYKLAIFPSITGLAAAAAIENALNTLKTAGTSNSPDLPLFNFREFNGLIGFEEVWEFERRWARNADRSKM